MKFKKQSPLKLSVAVTLLKMCCSEPDFAEKYVAGEMLEHNAAMAVTSLIRVIALVKFCRTRSVLSCHG